MKNGNALDLDQFVEFLRVLLVVIKRMWKDLEGGVAQHWITNSKELEQKLLNVLDLTVINCDEAPYLPEGWSIPKDVQLSNRVHGQYKWNPDEAKVYLFRNARKKLSTTFNDVLKELEEQLVLPANVIDFLLENQSFIPNEWKEIGRKIFFWGTIFREEDGVLVVRCLYYFRGEWNSNYALVDHDWDEMYSYYVAAA